MSPQTVLNITAVSRSCFSRSSCPIFCSERHHFDDFWLVRWALSTKQCSNLSLCLSCFHCTNNLSWVFSEFFPSSHFSDTVWLTVHYFMIDTYNATWKHKYGYLGFALKVVQRRPGPTLLTSTCMSLLNPSVKYIHINTHCRYIHVHTLAAIQQGWDRYNGFLRILQHKHFSFLYCHICCYYTVPA